MKFKYWTVTLQHDPVLLDRQGLGVIVESDGDYAVRLISQEQLRIDAMSPESERASRAVLAELGGIFVASDELPNLITTATNRWNNAVRVQPSRDMSADMTLDEAAEYLFSMYVRHPDQDQKRPPVEKTA